jgi:tRNA A37 methylthiotransferase MiaB
MLGLPGESITSQETTLKLFKKHTPKRIQTFWTSFLPGTDMFKKAVADGTINKEKIHDLVAWY